MKPISRDGESKCRHLPERDRLWGWPSRWWRGGEQRGQVKSSPEPGSFYCQPMTPFWSSGVSTVTSSERVSHAYGLSIASLFSLPASASSPQAPSPTPPPLPSVPTPTLHSTPYPPTSLAGLSTLPGLRPPNVATYPLPIPRPPVPASPEEEKKNGPGYERLRKWK